MAAKKKAGTKKSASKAKAKRSAKAKAPAKPKAKAKAKANSKAKRSKSKFSKAKVKAARVKRSGEPTGDSRHGIDCSETPDCECTLASGHEGKHRNKTTGHSWD